MKDKCADYCKGLLESQKKQSTAVLSIVSVSKEAFVASYFVAEIIAQEEKITQLVRT